MYPKHVGHENGGCGHLGGAPLSRPTFGGHSCKKDCMVAPHESARVAVGLAKVSPGMPCWPGMPCVT
jgi:hypothetical protein